LRWRNWTSRAAFGALTIGVMAVFALVLIFVATALSRADLVPTSKALPEVST